MRNTAKRAAPANAKGQLLSRQPFVGNAVHQFMQNDVSENRRKQDKICYDKLQAVKLQRLNLQLAANRQQNDSANHNQRKNDHCDQIENDAKLHVFGIEFFLAHYPVVLHFL